MPNIMDYSLIHHSPDGTGMFLVTLPGTPDRGSYMTEQEFKEWIVSSIGGGTVPKGDILSTNLPPADASNKGWQYYCTDLNKYAISDGTAWIYFSNSPIVQTPDATDTGHALSNAVVTQCCNEVKGRLDQHDARLQNLEQKAGDYGTWHYPNDPDHSSDMPNKVPTGKAKYGLVKSVVGKTRAWNQLSDAGQHFTNSITDTRTYFRLRVISSVSPYPTLYNVDFTENATIAVIVTATFTSSAVIKHGGSTTDITIGHIPSIINGHKYLISGEVLGHDPTVVGGIKLDNFQVFDLTLIFGSGNEPSTVADALAQLPALGQYNAYDAGSLVDTEVSGVKSVGVNIWDGAREVGDINGSTGADAPSSTRWRSIGYTQILPDTEYYIQFNGGIVKVRARFYDISKNYIGYEDLGGSEVYTNSPFTTPTNAYYMRIAPNISNIPLDSPIQICLNSYADKTTYHPYMTDTLSLSETVTLRSAGSVAEVLTLETGKKTRPLIEFDLGDLTYGTPNSDGRADSTALPSNVKAGSYSEPANAVCAKYLIGNWGDDRNTNGILVIYQTVSVCDSAFIGKTGAEVKNLLTGVKVLAERITPDTDLSVCDPIIDNTLYTEGGGTIETIQTQSPVIDNCLDVGYLAV